MNMRNLAISILILMFSTNAMAGVLYGIDRDGDNLISVDLNTFAATTVGSLGTDDSYGGLAYDVNGDIMYMAPGRNNNTIYTVNYTTGAATLLGTHGITDVFGLAFDSSNNVLYGSTTQNTVYSFSQVDGSATLIGTTGSNIGGLAYDSAQDRLIGIATGGAVIYEINRSTGAATILQSSLPSTNDVGFTYDFENNLFYSLGLNGLLIEYTPTTFAATQIASGLPAIDGLTFIGIPSQSLLPALGIPSLSTLGLSILIIVLLMFGYTGYRRLYH